MLRNRKTDTNSINLSWHSDDVEKTLVSESKAASSWEFIVEERVDRQPTKLWLQVGLWRLPQDVKSG